MGIVGFAIFCRLMKRVFHQILLLYRMSSPWDSFNSALSTGFLAGVVGILANSFFGETLESPRILGPFWFMTALIVTLANIKKIEEEGTEWEEFMLETFPKVQENIAARSK